MGILQAIINPDGNGGKPKLAQYLITRGLLLVLLELTLSFFLLFSAYPADPCQRPDPG